MVLKVTRENTDSSPALRSAGQPSIRLPMKVSAVAAAKGWGPSPCTALMKFTCGTRKLLPFEVNNSRAIRS